jgi:uncharacterized protein
VDLGLIVVLLIDIINMAEATGTGENGITHNHQINLTKEMSGDDGLGRAKTNASIPISPEFFEKLYLSPQLAVKGDLRKKFANPTPMSVFCSSKSTFTPLTLFMQRHCGFCYVPRASGMRPHGMAWRRRERCCEHVRLYAQLNDLDVGELTLLTRPAFLFFGGVLMMLGGLLEFFLGNTFPSVVFCTFGAFYPTFGATLLPQFNAFAAYAPADATSPTAGLQTQGFNASFGKFLCLTTMHR